MNPDGHVIGLDIGATGIRAAVMSQLVNHGRPTVRLDGVGRIALPPGVIVNGEVQEPAIVSDALKQLWSQHKLECRHVVVGAASRQLLVRDLTMPNLDPERRAQALPFQAKEVVALPLDDLVLDFCPLREPDPGDEQVDGILVATPREPILGAVAAVEQANLKVARVDLSPLGLLRAAADEQAAVEAIIDLGAQLTTIVIHDHGMPKLVRTIARGAAELTEQLADRMSIDVADAEAAKRDGGLRHDNAEIARCLNERLHPLVAEIRTSIGYFRRSHEDADIQHISLTGGGAQLNGITKTLSDQLGIPVRIVDPLNNVSEGGVHVDDVTALPSAVAVGLAMGLAA